VWERSQNTLKRRPRATYPADPDQSAISEQLSEPGGELLAAETVADYLVARGLIADPRAVRAQQLGGGVSNVVLAVTGGGASVVVKQALPRLRVPDEWLAKRERAIGEADGLTLAREITPGHVPALLDLDRPRCALTIAAAPDTWVTWKSRLLAGAVDEAVAARLGGILAAWQRATFGDETVARRFADYEAFEQLRVDPFYRTVALRRPELAEPIDACIRQMESTHLCLVHGDYSPKNVLVGDGVWVIDFEVAHYGDPVFDVAFMLHHLLLKLVHVPRSSRELERCVNGFWQAYRTAVPGRLLPELDYLLAHVGALMAARVDGKSPAEYLSHSDRAAAREASSRMLRQPPGSLAEALAVVRSVRV
jgi:5-methylthioribose kinase